MVGSEGVEPLAKAPDLQSFAVYLTVTLPKFVIGDSRNVELQYQLRTR